MESKDFKSPPALGESKDFKLPFTPTKTNPMHSDDQPPEKRMKVSQGSTLCEYVLFYHFYVLLL